MMDVGKKMIPVPSVGRGVHYTSYGSPGGEFLPACRAATITEVETPGDPYSRVRLCIMNPTGLFFSDLLPYGSAPGQWHWMEYAPAVEVSE